MAITNAIIKAGGKALTKGSEKAIEKATTSAITKATEKAVNKALTKTATSGLTGLLGGKLATGSGSTLDGILGRSSGLTLKNATLPKTTSLAEKYANTPLAKTAKQEISEIAGRNSKLLSEIDDAGNISYDVAGDIATGEVPYYKKDDEVYNKLRKIASDQNVSTFADSENMMIDYSKLSPSDRSDILDGLLNKENTLMPDYVKEDYAGTKLEPEGLINENQLRLIDQEAGRTPRKIAVDEIPTRRKNVKVSRPVADMGVDEAVAETDNTGLANKIAEMNEQLRTATGGAGRGNGGGTPTATASPDYGGLGDSGFANKLNEQANRPINVQVRADGGAGKATPQQQGQRYVRDKAIKRLNATPRQYADLMGKSRSIGNYYEKVADRIEAENIVQANVAQKTEAVLNHIENIKARAFRTADELGLTIDLSGIDNTIGLKPYQKKQLTDLGYNLNDIIGDKALSATQAEEVYRILRGYAYDLLDESAKPFEKAAGRELNKVADEVSKRIDDVLDNMGLDFKKEFLDGAGIGGADMNGTYLREISQNGKPLSFSDLRREESDWINIGKVANRPIKEEKIPESITEAIGQGFKKGGEKIREKYYERQAYGAGGGNMGGGSVPPTGGTGAEGNINFETVGGGRTGTLGNLLGKAKSAGLVGAGVLGGMMLGGGGNGSSNVGELSSLSNAMMPEEEEEIDPYTTLTIGGYDYNTLENGYVAALQAGDTEAAKLIANMLGMLEDKISNYQKQKDSSKSDIAAKQKAALNVLSGLISNYEAQGPIRGNITGFLNTISGGEYDPNAYAYSSGAEGSLGTIIKALGDTGMLSEGDQKRARNLMPKITDSPEAARVKYQQLLQIIAGAGEQ